MNKYQRIQSKICKTTITTYNEMFGIKVPYSGAKRLLGKAIKCGIDLKVVNKENIYEVYKDTLQDARKHFKIVTERKERGVYHQ